MGVSRSRTLAKITFHSAHRPTASGSDLSPAPCAQDGAKTQLTRTPSESAGSGLRSACFPGLRPSSDCSELERPPPGRPAITGRTPESSLPALFHRLFPRSTRLSWAQPLRPLGAVGARESEADPTAQLLAPAGAGRLHGLQTGRAGPRKILGSGIPGSREHGGGPGHGGGNGSASGEGLRN